jgi:S1-C subfamily serine protease
MKGGSGCSPGISFRAEIPMVKVDRMARTVNYRLSISLIILLSAPALGQTSALSQRQACEKFSSAVVSIDAGGQSRGTGFIVSPDGLIMTVSHVIRDVDGAYHGAISVQLSTGENLLATPAIPISAENVGKDFALLKVTAKEKLPFLMLGSEQDINIGSDATIIGYPFSAITRADKPVETKFCLSASFAAVQVETVPVNGSQPVNGRKVPFNKDVKVDVVYFQGPSVRGLSGSPVVSRDNGRVVGILSTKLTAISPSLAELKEETAKGLGANVYLSGLQPGPAINQILTVLDNQLANGLGSAVGIDDPKEAAESLRRSPR